MTGLPIIPEFITVHLGAPDAPAENVTVAFQDYIKNVASSEIYPTWPESAIRANIYAQISFALNRIYTEYYRTRGYDFDITNSTAIDQSFVYGRDIFDNISQIVDEIFNDYIVRRGFVEPLYALYCNGTTTTCAGLSQWGTVSLAESGRTPYEILQYYYGENIDIVDGAPTDTLAPSYPGVPLSLSSVGDAVRTIQTRLNRISANYPAIPKISNADGIFSTETYDAVVAFQRIFSLTPDGIVGKATWYKIRQIYNAVKKLNELQSEGISLSDVEKKFPGVLTKPDTGADVAVVQYYLATLSDFDPKIPEPPIDGVFGDSTQSAVTAFQNAYGLTPLGEVDELTWNKLASVYLGLEMSIAGNGNTVAIKFPGTFLNLGSEGEDVTALQTYLNGVRAVYTEIPELTVDGVYGARTREAVIIFQRIVGLPENGVVGPFTWDFLAEKYNEIENGSLRADFQYGGNTIT